ncbi:putative Peptidase U62, TldE-like [Nitrospira sp. KM1]|nr:putative Peptidase U62, TldE-like [Nitrospira sp. KM1]
MTTMKGWPKLTGREEFGFLCDLLFERSSGDATTVTLSDQHSGTTRFANSQVIQNVDTRRGTLTVTVAFDGRRGTASTTNFTAGSMQDTLLRAERIAKASPEDPEYLPPPEGRSFAQRETARVETAAAGPARRLEYTNEAVGQCRIENLQAAGIVSSSSAAAGIAASNGLFAHEVRTDARFSLTVQAGDATGWSAAAHRSIDHLKVQERTLTAIGKAKRSVETRELPPGKYTVILEPAAVAGLVTWLLWLLDAKSYDKGTSPVAGQLGRQILDTRLTLQNLPDHPDLFGVGFTSEGLPSDRATWIEHGTLNHLMYDRFTAKMHGLSDIPTLEAPCLSMTGVAEGRTADLLKQIDRAILVTNFWYIRTVNPADLTLTGMTRDGTFLVENGQIVSAVKNFRFHESPLRAFNRIEGFTHPAEAVTSETGKMLVPSMLIREFNFSSVTTF